VFVFLRFYAFELQARTGQINGQTDGQARPVIWPTGRPHKKHSGWLSYYITFIVRLLTNY